MQLPDYSQIIATLGNYKGSLLSAQVLYASGATLAVLVVAFVAGRQRLMISIVALYIAWGTASIFPLATMGYDREMIKLVIFGIAFIVALFVLSRSFLRRRFSMKDSSITAVLIAAIAFCGLLLAMLTVFLPPDLLNRLPDLILTVFKKPAAQVGWFLLPLLVIFLAKGSPERRPRQSNPS